MDRSRLRAVVNIHVAETRDQAIDNIRYGWLEAKLSEITAAAKAANAHDFIARLPNGYDTIIGERGTFISGGSITT